MCEDIWDEKPKAVEVAEAYAENYYHASDMDAWLEKLKTHYEPYDKLLKAEPLMPMDIKSVLAKEGMPILIDEGWFDRLNERAKKLEAVRNKVAEWDSIHMRDRHAAPSILVDLEKILEAEGNK